MVFKQSLRRLGTDTIPIDQLIWVEIKDSDLDKDSGVDKSVKSIELSDLSETKIKFFVNFKDRKAITKNLAEPDELMVKILNPEAFVSKRSGKSLEVIETTKLYTIVMK